LETIRLKVVSQFHRLVKINTWDIQQ